MANTKKIRLILMTNALTSLFMSAWFRQNKYIEDSGIQTILVFAHLKVNDAYSEKSNEKTLLNYESCQAPWDDFDFQWLTFQPDHSFFLGSFKDYPFREYKKRKKNMHTLISWLSLNSIHPEEVYEIWHSNDLIDVFLFQLCNNAREVSFEHGLSDVYSQLSSINKVPIKKPMWQLLKQKDLDARYQTIKLPYTLKIISSLRGILKFIYYSSLLKGTVITISNHLQNRIHVSLLADEIRAAGSDVPQGKIDPLEVKQLISHIMENDTSVSRFNSLEGNIAVILLSQIKPFALSPDDHIEYYQDLKKYILCDWGVLFERYNIKHIVFKTQMYHEDFFCEAFEGFVDLKNKYQIHILAKHPEKNINIEFYLHLLKPTLLIGVYSSALVYTKKIYPNLKTLTYHDWVIDYTMRRYHNTYPEFYTWFPKIFEVNFGYVFRPILPDKAPYTAYINEEIKES